MKFGGQEELGIKAKNQKLGRQMDVLELNMKDTLYDDFEKQLDLKIQKFQNTFDNKIFDQNEDLKDSLQKSMASLGSKVEMIQDFLEISKKKKNFFNADEFYRDMNKKVIDQALASSQQQFKKMIEDQDLKLEEQIQIFKIELNTIYELRRSLNFIDQKIEEKASIKLLRTLEKELQIYAKQSDIQALIEKLHTKLDKNDQKAIYGKFEDQQSKFKKIDNTIVKLKNLMEEAELKFKSFNEVSEREKNKSQEQQEHRLFDVKQTIKQIQEKLDKHLIKNEEDQQRIREQIKNRASVQYVDHLKFTLNNYVSKSYIDEIVYDIKPKVNKMNCKVDNFDKKILQISEVIRRFDEVISSKASKIQILELQNDFQNKYLSLDKFEDEKYEMNSQISANNDLCNETQEDMKNFREFIKEELTQLTQTIIKDKMCQFNRMIQKYESALQGKDLAEILNSKPDIDQLFAVEGQKADRTDIFQCYKIMQNIHDQLKHLSTLQVELSTTLLPTPAGTETTNTKSKRRDYVYRQSLFIQQMIYDFQLDQQNLIKNNSDQQNFGFIKKWCYQLGIENQDKGNGENSNREKYQSFVKGRKLNSQSNISSIAQLYKKNFSLQNSPIHQKSKIQKPLLKGAPILNESCYVINNENEMLMQRGQQEISTMSLREKYNQTPSLHSSKHFKVKLRSSQQHFKRTQSQVDIKREGTSNSPPKQRKVIPLNIQN